MTTKSIVLVIEDEKNICDFISTSLLTQNYKVLKAYSGKEGLSILTSSCPDLLLLDLGLPDMDGIEIIKNVRSWSNLPIVIISARNQETDKVLALDLGADDYVTKPFGTDELFARIRTALRHSHKTTSNYTSLSTQFTANGLTIDFDKHLIYVHGQEVHLTQIEYKILVLLAEHAGKILTYDSMITSIWGPYADKNNRILRVNMANIRRKIEENPADPQYIFTELGIGYRLIEEDESSSC